ncbi:MAG: PIN domain protein [Planctomycetota bacterium]|nr:PIN domain protein [Planctomycetota bacterium]
MKKFRIYVDTSVIGGCLDEEFEEESQALIEMVRDGEVVLLVSDLLVQELEESPSEVQDILLSLPPVHVERVVMDEESERLQQAYLKEKVVTPRHSNDAHHVSLATIATADLVLSWNFRHIVHFNKIRGFNAVNLREGYQPLEIRSPKEFV